jgi:hypothetical protein
MTAVKADLKFEITEEIIHLQNPQSLIGMFGEFS